jgi:hypothetical protein
MSVKDPIRVQISSQVNKIVQQLPKALGLAQNLFGDFGRAIAGSFVKKVVASKGLRSSADSHEISARSDTSATHAAAASPRSKTNIMLRNGSDWTSSTAVSPNGARKASDESAYYLAPSPIQNIITSL